MAPFLSRRTFLARCALAGGCSALPGFWKLAAREPLARPGPARLRLSLAAYSFRDSFADSNHKQNRPSEPSKRIDLFNFIDFCADHGCDGTELTSYYFPPAFDDEFLLKLKRHCFLRGIDISGTAVGNTFTPPPGAKRDQEIASVKKWIDHAQVLGAPHIRVFAGTLEKNQDKVDAKKLCIAALEECGAYALERGIYLGIENHGGIVAEPADLLDIIKAVKSPAIGINLDTGNFHTADPYHDLELIAPYAVNVQIKAEIHPMGQALVKADLQRLVNILRDAHYQGYVALEYESAEDPWKAVPELLKQLQPLCRAAGA